MSVRTQCVSGRGNGCQAVRTPYIYIVTNIHACARQYKFHHLTYLKEARFDQDPFVNKTLGRALDPRANGTWLSKLTE